MRIDQTKNVEVQLAEKASYNMQEAKKISGMIRDARKRNDYSQEELAEKSGLSSMQISRLETGKNMPSVKTLVKLEPYIGRSLEELLIAASYSGTVPTSEKTYVDLAGKKCDLKSIAEEMYQIDAELFFKIYEYYKNSSASDNRFLKAVFEIVNMEKKALQSGKSVIDDDRQLWSVFHHMKSIFLIIVQRIKKNTVLFES